MHFQKVFSKSFLHLIVLFITVIWFLPTLGLLITSFRNRGDVANSGWWEIFFEFWDLSWFTLQNYTQVWTDENLGAAFWNSIIISVPASIIPILIAAMAAFALAWMRFPGRRLILGFTVVMLIVPLQLTFVPVLQAYREVDGVLAWFRDAFPFLVTLTDSMDLEKWSGSLPAIWFAHSGYAMPLMIFLIYNFIVELPEALFESASIDGANTWVTFWKIVFPLALPGMASALIFQFLWVWNSLLVNLIYVGFGSSYQPLPLVVTDIGQMGQDWEKLTAAAFVLIFVPMLVFFGLQRFFVRGLLGGSVKG
jgi:alpha-glucoside transport system permease protein